MCQFHLDLWASHRVQIADYCEYDTNISCSHMLYGISWLLERPLPIQEVLLLRVNIRIILRHSDIVGLGAEYATSMQISDLPVSLVSKELGGLRQ
jgi:hypothetical protein